MQSQQLANSRVAEAVDRLKDEFEDVIEVEKITELVAASFESYNGARIVDFVPLLVYKSTREYLLTMAEAGERPQRLSPAAP